METVVLCTYTLLMSSVSAENILVSLASSDLVDFDKVYIAENASARTSRTLVGGDGPWELHSVQGRRKLPKKGCDEQRSRNLQKRPIMFLVHLHEYEAIEELLDDFALTIENCSQRIRPGDYHPNNVFLYSLPEDGSRVSDMVLTNHLSKRHRHVAALLPLGGKGKYVVKRFNVYDGVVQNTKIVGSTNKEREEMASIFSPFNMKGHSFIVGNMPYSYFGSSDFDENARDPTRAFHNHSGGEIWALKAVCEVLHCEVIFTNPKNLHWGTVSDGETSGIYLEVTEERADFALGGLTLTHDRCQVMKSTHAYFDMAGMVVVGPKPRPKWNAFVYMEIFLPSTWFAISLAILLLPVPLVFVASTECKIKYHSNYWVSLPKAGWYVYGTFLGESITKQIRVEKAWATRIVICAWYFSSLVITAAFGGSLRAYVMQPSLSDPVETMEDIVNSGLPWRMPLYGETVEKFWAEHSDPTVKELWHGKEIVGYSDFPHKYLMDAQEGDGLYVEWINLVKVAVEAGFSHSNGDLLVHISDPIGPWHSSNTKQVMMTWFFHPLNPWSERFERVLQMVYDTGLRQFWFKRAIFKLAIKIRGSVKITAHHQNDGNFHKVSMDDKTGIFLLAGLLYLSSCFVFLHEKRHILLAHFVRCIRHFFK